MAQRLSRAARRAADPAVQQRAEQHRIDAERADRLAVENVQRQARQAHSQQVMRTAREALSRMPHTFQ